MPDPLTLFLFEDNAIDRLLAQELLHSLTRPVDVFTPAKETDIPAFIGRTGPYAGLPTPDIFLTDIHMPIYNGFEVVRMIQACPHYAHTRCVVMSGVNSRRQADYQEESYHHPVDLYMLKPVTRQSLIQMLEALEV